MKAKVIIENGCTEIILTPENEFEEDVLEKVYENKYEITNTKIYVLAYYGIYSKHKITININKKPKQ